MKLTNEQARRAYTALHFELPGMDGLAPVDQVIAQVRARNSIQYDPIDVVGRNPDLVLQSRVAGYRPAMLQEALYSRRALVDGGDKCLCIYPMEDYPYLKPRDGGAWVRQYYADEISTGREVALNVMAERGAICSDDLEGMNQKVRWPWGSTRLSRAVIESLWLDGRLVIHHKAGARRYFDLIERHMPREIMDTEISMEENEWMRWIALRRIESVGMLWNRASDAFLDAGMKREAREYAFAALESGGDIAPIEVEGLKYPLYLPAKNLPLVEAALERGPRMAARVIAPLDNFMWDRKLIEALFRFKYRWEIYTPAAKREYGYYVLPILCGDSLVARFEPENNRGGPLVVKSFWWENGVKPSAAMRAAVDDCLGEFEKYLSGRAG